MIRKCAAALLMALSLLGCGQPTIDASSEEAFQSSAARVREALPSEQRGRFDEALHLLVFSRIGDESILAEGGAAVDALDEEARAAVHGRTGTQLIAEADRVRAEGSR